ncbi:hypothetical protein Sbal117_4789 (plasmid) [Shewanella baltica OS117]|nr:hypothetical protein Sbal117_4789 [Shewanella baltica OS117]
MKTLKQKLAIDIASLDLKRRKPSKISPYKDQLLILSKFMSYRELAAWLKNDKEITISPSSIHHMLKKWENEKT